MKVLYDPALRNASTDTKESNGTGELGQVRLVCDLRTSGAVETDLDNISGQLGKSRELTAASGLLCAIFLSCHPRLHGLLGLGNKLPKMERYQE